MMAEQAENSGSFGSFWQKVSGKGKTVKFMPNITRPEGGNGNLDSTLSSPCFLNFTFDTRVFSDLGANFNGIIFLSFV
jgi:hypothetical protein